MAAMYVVIMAGGGGTRLRPLSTAERPKPFLPLLPTGETLLQRTVRRLDGPELGAVDVYVVASAAYAPLIEAQVPEARLVIEPEGRNTAAAIALAALAIDRPEDEVMVVLPADHRIDPAREGTFRAVLASAAAGLAGGAFGVERPLVTLGIEPHPSGDAVRLSQAVRPARRDHRGPPGVPARSVRGEARPRARRRARPHAGRRVERGHVPVAPRRDP